MANLLLKNALEKLIVLLKVNKDISWLNSVGYLNIINIILRIHDLFNHQYDDPYFLFYAFTFA